MGQFPFRTLICFCCNDFDAKHRYVLSYQGIFLNDQLQKQSRVTLTVPTVKQTYDETILKGILQLS